MRTTYKRNNGYLHSGESAIGDFDKSNFDVQKGFEYVYHFDLSIDCESIGILEDLAHNKGQIDLRINILDFCMHLCDAAEQYYHNTECKGGFEEHGYRFISVTDFNREFEKHNPR